MRRLIWGFADCLKSHVTAQLYSFEASDAKSDVCLQVCLFAPDLIWQDVGDLLDTNYLHNLKAGGRERETSACIWISCNLDIMYRCWKWYLEMLLARIGFCTTKSDIRQYWYFACFLSHAQMFKLTKHYFLNSIRIWSGSELWQRFFSSFFKGERIQISLKTGHHRPASETPLNGVSLACRWWPNVECWLGSFENSWGSGPVLLRNSIFFFIFQRGGPDPLSPPLDPRMGPDNVYTYWDILKTHFIVRIGFCTALCILSIACTIF